MPWAPDTSHTPGPLAGSTANSTGLPDPPPLAATVADWATWPRSGAVNPIDWGMPVTTTTGPTCGARW